MFSKIISSVTSLLSLFKELKYISVSQWDIEHNIDVAETKKLSQRT